MRNLYLDIEAKKLSEIANDLLLRDVSMLSELEQLHFHTVIQTIHQAEKRLRDLIENLDRQQNGR